MSSTTYRRKRFGTGMLETIMATAMVSISLVAALNSMAFVINSSYRNAENAGRSVPAVRSCSPPV
jgi:hypothetical protein